MKIASCTLLVCFLGAGVMPVFANGIDLVALKKKEEERRKKIAKSKMAVNDTNINSVSVDGKKYGFVQLESDEPLDEESAAPSAGKDDKGDVTRQPDFWKKQQSELQDRITKLKEDIGREQEDLNKLWSDFYIKNIPAEQDAIKVQISQLTNQVEQKKLFLSQFESQLEDLYEKARKAGIPPGWLR
jgi:vacuolar-type H+-ATPase subunit I/STV1